MYKIAFECKDSLNHNPADDEDDDYLWHMDTYDPNKPDVPCPNYHRLEVTNNLQIPAECVGFSKKHGKVAMEHRGVFHENVCHSCAKLSYNDRVALGEESKSETEEEYWV